MHQLFFSLLHHLPYQSNQIKHDYPSCFVSIGGRVPSFHSKHERQMSPSRHQKMPGLPLIHLNLPSHCLLYNFRVYLFSFSCFQLCLCQFLISVFSLCSFLLNPISPFKFLIFNLYLVSMLLVTKCL